MDVMKKYQKKAQVDLINSEIELSILMMKFRKIALLYFKKLPLFKIYSLTLPECFYYILENYSKFPDKLKNWIDKNIFSCADNNYFIIEYIISLTNCITNNETEKIVSLINSFKKTKFIKDISFNNEKKTFKLISLNDDILYFKPMYETYNEKYINACHKLTYESLKKYDENNEKVYGVSMLFPMYYDNKQYHSFIVKDGKIIDASHNLIADYNSYKKVINPEIIFYEDAKTIINNIDNLYKDDSFDKEMYPLVNYAISKQINKKYNK